MSELEVALQAPDGTTVMLADNTGMSGQNFSGTILDDDAEGVDPVGDDGPRPVQRALAARTAALGPRRQAAGGHLEAARAGPRRGPDYGTVTSWSLLLPACNIAPVAELMLGPGLRNAGTPITLDASQSSDRDDAIAEYRWDFDGNGTIDEVTRPRSTSHTSAPRAPSRRRSRSSTRAARARSGR